MSLAMRKAVYSRESGEVALALLTISHPSMAVPIRLSSDPTTRISEEPLTYATISRGETFRFFPFNLSLPDDSGERAPVAQLQIENVSRSLVSLVRSIRDRANVTIELALASSPDVVEAEFVRFEIRTVRYDANLITFTLGIEALTDEPFPAGSFDPSRFGGLF